MVEVNKERLVSSLTLVARTAECSESQDVGNCTNTKARWSFNQTEDRCVPFYYTGCNGNGNKYVSKEECENACPSSFGEYFVY